VITTSIWASGESQSPGLQRHLHRLAQASAMLADLSQADVLIMRSEGHGFRIISHVRPMNARTIYPVDQVDEVLPMSTRPLLTRAFESGEVMDGGVFLPRQGRWIRTLAVPVRFEGEIVAVLAREFAPHIEIMPGDLEIHAFATFRRFAAMVASGSFPFGVETRRHDHPPRVGDGIMLFDKAGKLEYASPNALTVLRHVGASMVNLGDRLGDMGVDAPGVRQSFANRLDYTDEIEVGHRVLSTYCVPLLTKTAVTGALVLLRNITELRQRDRLLMTKDATIAEIHHRVKNSLQTASSLLQLQSRRVATDDAKAALAESARRIRTIGVVHELLSHRTDDEVQFGPILEMLTTMIRDSLVDPTHPVQFEIDCDPAILPNNLTTPLALIASELIQNAIDHADCKTVTIMLRTQPDAVVLTVADDGTGFPNLDEPAPAAQSSGLGMTIVGTIAQSELGGSLTIGDNDPGARIEVRVPLFDER
jgi:two-component sensor histidine kinase